MPALVERRNDALNNTGKILFRNPVPFFIVFWALLNLLQIAFTELTSDEGYYWFYAQHLQWGYYDHPPMIAAMIKAGSKLFGGTIGVRAFNVVLSTAGLSLFFQLIPEELKRSPKTYWVLLSAPLLHYLTFLVFPDGPLLFFSLAFLVLYKRFLVKKNFETSLLLGLSIALMAYSKYHGALVLLFTIIANPRLLKSAYFYLALFVAAILFAPHLWWQYKNDFPTLKYHLSGRTGTWSFKHVGEYVSQQIFAIGPGLIFLPFVVKTKDVFERTLKFIIIGTLLFFLVSSFKTFVHFHWTSIALYPLLYFAVRYYNNPAHKKLFNALILPFVVLFFVARILLMLPLIPNMHVGEDYYHGRKTWAEEVKSLADNRPVFMPDNLREASLYSFYSGGQGVTLYTRPGKKSQYELWGYEDSLQGKDVLFLSKYPYTGGMKTSLLNKDFYYGVVSSFQSYYNGIAVTASVDAVTADTLKATVNLFNQTSRMIAFQKNDSAGYTGIAYSIEQARNVLKADAALPLKAADNLAPGATITKTIRIPIQDVPQGDYEIYFGIRSGVLPDAILSEGLPFIKK
ncbi:ArnT family glycosyltransferase [Flavisolibacter ginsenosidimutans]|uniref:Glycosyltransferase RgtA/B/C/D-like domain-containing protein n=1 Tax=Flavisolibacter ginsenosidimutans TaxID=661481 RepID=A0A5B8UJV5_9BACT|nr:glycosyltransferase family 39 protein [Flavisolibacter ginsenosidimutans]QEC56977.1 hypothetical protein FSB75_14070 [Flavisolibacter ginsenosidimutans]